MIDSTLQILLYFRTQGSYNIAHQCKKVMKKLVCACACVRPCMWVCMCSGGGGGDVMWSHQHREYLCGQCTRSVDRIFKREV